MNSTTLSILRYKEVYNGNDLASCIGNARCDDTCRLASSLWNAKGLESMMTWFEFRSKVDEYLAENSVDPQEVTVEYLELPSTGRLEDLEINIEEGFLATF